jgi:uncharacterized protein
VTLLPAYGPAGWAWCLQWAIHWGSWLVFPLLLWWSVRLLRGWRSATFGQRARLTWPLLAALLFIEMRFIEPTLIVERRMALELGFQARIVLIADYHVGLYKRPEFLARVVERINAMEGVDAVLIAGDHLHEPDRPIAELLAPLKLLRHPTYSVPGNHDELPFGPVQHAELRAVLKSLGVQPVEYGHVVTPKFTVVGLGDRFAGKDNPGPLAAAPRDKPIIVVAHNPDSAMQLKPGAAALFVSGHTHGGQIRIPWLYRRVIPTEHPFDRGLHRFGPVPVFVTSGLGEVGLPMRFLNPPVIDVLDIR